MKIKKGCPSCYGTGKIRNHWGQIVECPLCGGSGVYVSPYKLERR